MKYFVVFLLTSLLLFSDTVSFDSVLKDAMHYSVQLKIIETDKMIKDAQIEETESLYYPILSAGFNTQYTKGLNGTGDIASVGDTVLSDQTQYESSAALRLDYNVYDFGVRGHKKKIAQIDRELVDQSLLKNKQELKLKVLNIYAEILRLKKQIYFTEKIKRIEKQIYKAKQRLYNAGELDKLSVASHAIKIVELATKLEQDKFTLDENLNALSYYTGKTYTLQTDFALGKANRLKEILFEESASYKEITLQKEQKLQELELSSSERYPKISLYGRYNLYGSNEYDAWDATQNIHSRNYVVGIGVNWTLFDGFKSSATQKRLKAELMQLELKELDEKQKFMQQHKEVNQKLASLKMDIGNLSNEIDKHQKRTKMQKRLQDIHEIDMITILESRIEKLHKQFELDSSLTKKKVKLKELELLNENI